MAGPIIEIDPIVREKRVGGIEDVAEFRENERLGAGEAIVFQSQGCTFPRLSEHLCYTGSGTPDKTFDGIGIDDQIGEPFVLYTAVRCTAAPDPEELERAERLLEEGAGRELEAALFAWAAGGVVAGGGTVAGIGPAIARIEQQLDATYLGRGVILMSRYDALNAGAVALRDAPDGGPLFTKLGTPVIASGRVTPGTVYGLGAVVVEHSPTKSVETIDPEINQDYGLAEAVYVIAVDCEFRIKTAIA